MILSLRYSDKHITAFGSNWSKFLYWGIALVVLGAIAICAATLTTMLSVVILGFLILFSGAILIADSFTFWWNKWNGFFLHLLIGILYFFVGLMLVSNPVAASVSLTLLLGIFYTVIGIVRIGFSSTIQAPQWGWGLSNGVITLILGILILTNWPASSLYIIGLFIRNRPGILRLDLHHGSIGGQKPGRKSKETKIIAGQILPGEFFVRED